MRLALPCLAMLALGLTSPVSAAQKGKVKKACDRAANWLIEHHDLKTGTFGKGDKSKMIGLVAIVIKGLTNSPRKYTEDLGPFVSEPVAYLLKNQQESGAIALKGKGRETYSTAMAIVALQSTKNPAYKGAIDKAKAYLLKCQREDGGFSYRAEGKQGSDLSNTWLALAGLKAAGVKGDSDTFKKAVVFIRRCQDNPETNPDAIAKGGNGTGGAYYQPGKSEFGTVKSRSGKEVPVPYSSMTAAALEGLLICGLKTDAPEVAAALKWFKKHGNISENHGGGQKGFFYFCMAFARAMDAAGIKDWKAADGTTVKWADLLATELLKRQRPDGTFVNKEPHWMEDNVVLCTGYALNALDICYKHMK